LSSLTVSPISVTGGNSSQGTVTLTGAAPSGGAVVALSLFVPGNRRYYGNDSIAEPYPRNYMIPWSTGNELFEIQQAI
jgi:hypothetical protein